MLRGWLSPTPLWASDGNEKDTHGLGDAGQAAGSNMSPNLNEEVAAVVAVGPLDKPGREGHASSPSTADGVQNQGGRHVTDLIDSTHSTWARQPRLA